MPADSERGYDPWGRPRDADWQGVDQLPGADVTPRGFTDHEHIDGSRLIHMNGRAFDPLLGRFLSVDPVIQFPTNSQSLNPYSYIMNNPMSGTDPTGFVGVEPGGRPLESICGMGQISRCSGAGPLTLQQTVQLSNGVEGTVTLQVDAAGNVEIDSIEFSAPETLGGPDERPNGINMGNATEEHSFRAALAGTDSRFALRPLVSAGLAESNFVPGELVNSVSEQEQNIRAIEQQMVLTGDRGFTDLEGLANVVAQGGFFAIDLAIPLPPTFTLGKAKSKIFQTGVNITPRTTANKFRTIGGGGRTFVTEPATVERIIGPLQGGRISISGTQAQRLEGALGLRPGSLESRNIISVINGVSGRSPASPISGNTLFRGGGAGLPGGGKELTIQGIPSAGGQGIRQIILEVEN
ncbi:MAG: RHS repeat-associated core domain-containing protein [Xanthomonadaceae bacterium]|nr:RHS repeat-associated core domain-containing protein [Xanthomonadaceae bacterium]